MKRLTIYLKEVEKVFVETKKGGIKSKIFNTLSFKVSSEKEINEILTSFGENIKKSQLSNF